MRAVLFSPMENPHKKYIPTPSPGVFGSPKAKKYINFA